MGNSSQRNDDELDVLFGGGGIKLGDYDEGEGSGIDTSIFY